MLHIFSKTACIVCVIGFISFCPSRCIAQKFSESTSSQQANDQVDFLNHLSLNGPERSLRTNTLQASFGTSVSADTASFSSLKIKYSCMLDVLPNAIGNLALYHFIDEWYGVRYLLGGNSKDGIDCSAFIQKLYEQVFGISLLRTALMQVEETSLIKDASKCMEGDLVFFKSRNGRISHVGLYLMNDFFVHASSSQGIMISSLDEAYWSKRFACAGRVL